MWTEDLIEKYENINFEKISWANLSANHNLLFTEELIDKYLDKWEWHYLSSNPGISWTDYLIVKYKDKLDWNGLSENTSLFGQSC